MTRRGARTAVVVACCAAVVLPGAEALRAGGMRLWRAEAVLRKGAPLSGTTQGADDFLYMPRDLGDVVRPIRPFMLMPSWPLIDRITRIPAAVRRSRFAAQDTPTAEQGQMNELNDGELWKNLQPQGDGAVAVAPAPPTTPSVAIYDSTARSAAKAMGWRITAGIVTALTSLFFTGGSWKVALSMVGSDFASKSVTMFIGERLWNKSQAGRSATGGESPMRSVMKAVAWRLFAVCNTLVMGLFFAGSLEVASKIASTDAVIKTVLMILYERAWNRIKWGRIENVGGLGI